MVIAGAVFKIGIAPITASPPTVMMVAMAPSMITPVAMVPMRVPMPMLPPMFPVLYVNYVGAGIRLLQSNGFAERHCGSW
jgi:hypothetical protein